MLTTDINTMKRKIHS